jgi:hypothetical protein
MKAPSITSPKKQIPSSKMDMRKAMLSGLLRRHTSMGLDWISRDLHMGVRSSVTRAEKILKQRMLDDDDLRKLWEKLEMLQISSWSPFLK